MDLKDYKFVITGGHGFIGSAISSSLEQSGYNYVTVDRSPDNNLDYCTIEGDYREVDLDQELDGNTIVIHLACGTLPATAESHRDCDIRNEIAGTVEFIEKCGRNNIHRFVYFSSGGTVYGDHGRNKVAETHSTNPISSYGVVKLANEKYLQVINQLEGIPYLIIRPSNAYGWTDFRRENQGFIDVALRKIWREKILYIYGDYEITREYFFHGH